MKAELACPPEEALDTVDESILSSGACVEFGTEGEPSDEGVVWSQKAPQSGSTVHQKEHVDFDNVKGTRQFVGALKHDSTVLQQNDPSLPVLFERFANCCFLVVAVIRRVLSTARQRHIAGPRVFWIHGAAYD